MVSEVASLPSRISKCRWFFLELKEQWSEENTYEVCKYVWVLSKSMSKKAQWIGCNYNKAKDGFIAIIYFKHPIDVRIFSDLIRETWENPNVRPLADRRPLHDAEDGGASVAGPQELQRTWLQQGSPVLLEFG